MEFFKQTDGQGKDAQEASGRLEEIRELENKLISLKRKYIEDSASSPDGTASEGSASFLLVSIADKRLAFPLGNVREVIQAPAVAPMPERVKGVAGLVDYHGSTLAVIDLADIMQAGSGRISMDMLMVICSLDFLDFAVLVDEASDVITVAQGEVQVPEEVLPGALKALGLVKTPERGALIVDMLSVVFSVQSKNAHDAEADKKDGDSEDAGSRA